MSPLDQNASNRKGVWKSGRGKGRNTPKGRQLDDQALADVLALLGDRPRRRDLLIEFMHLIQDAHGCLSAAHLRALAEEMKLAQAEVYEVATFYAHFDVVKEGEAAPPALTIRVCDSLSCELAGAEALKSALEEGLENAFAFPGFVPAYIRPLFCRGIGPFRWCALSGDPEDIYKTDRKMKEIFPENAHLHQWLDMARERIAFQGLPARICWIGLGDRHKAGLAFNEMVRNGELSAPVVIGRDHLDSGSVASPNRETEAMKDGSDAVSDWPLLNALLNTASGATWVSLHHGGGVGMGFSQHSGMVICCDGTADADRRLERVLWNDPATGVMRHADAGYEVAVECARAHQLHLPGIL